MRAKYRKASVRVSLVVEAIPAVARLPSERRGAVEPAVVGEGIPMIHREGCDERVRPTSPRLLRQVGRVLGDGGCPAFVPARSS